MPFELRTDFCQKIMLRALDDKERAVKNGPRAKVKAAANNAHKSWKDYHALHGRALDILARAEAAEIQADADRVVAQTLIENVAELPESERAEGLKSAHAMRTDARRRSGKASEVISILRNKLGDDVVTTFEAWESALWEAVDAEEAKLATLDEIRREVLIAGDAITREDGERWNTLADGLRILTEETRVREARKAKGEKGPAPKITESILDDLDCFDSE